MLTIIYIQTDGTLIFHNCQNFHNRINYQSWNLVELWCMHVHRNIGRYSRFKIYAVTKMSRVNRGNWNNISVTRAALKTKFLTLASRKFSWMSEKLWLWSNSCVTDFINIYTNRKFSQCQFCFTITAKIAILLCNK